MGLFVLGAAASFLFGRFYCGWMCSINTVLTGVTFIKQKLKIRSAPVPSVFKKPWVRYSALGLFAAVFVFTIASGKRLPVLPILFGFGILLSLVYPEELWHRYLCPYGSILNLTSSKTKHGMQIDEDSCNNCGTCVRVCPSKAVVKNKVKHKINQQDCLVCMKCEVNCKKEAIRYN
jgi:polyferredoxin